MSRGDDTRNKIIEAAISTFGDFGYAATKTREIARRAKINHPLITYYFKSKLALWQECARVLQQESISTFRNFCIHAVTLDPEARFAALVRLLVTNASNSNAYAFMLRYALDREHAELGNVRAGILANSHDVWLSELVHAQKSGILPADVNPVLLQYMLIGMTSRLYMEPAALKTRSGIDVLDGEVMDQYIDAVLNTIISHPPEVASKRATERSSAKTRSVK